MKKNTIKIIFIVICLSNIIMCINVNKQGSSNKKYRSKTGWNENDKRGWFFSNDKIKKNKSVRGMVLIEGGSFTMGLNKDNILNENNNNPVRMHVKPFYIAETEVTNKEYREYLTWLKTVFPLSEKNNINIYEGALPDENVFSNELASDVFSLDKYLFSPQFSNYPVVGVSWLQAVNYCNWLTDRANEKILIDKNIISKNYYNDERYNYGEKTFNSEQYKLNDTNIKDIINIEKIIRNNKIKNKNKRIVEANRVDNSLEISPFRLPTEAEWEYAALALPHNREDNLYKGKKIVNSNMRILKGKRRGQFLDNFKQGRGDYSGIGGFGNDGSSITNDVKKYPPNEFGLYGMLGNVAEWVMDVYRPIIDDQINDLNYYRGNVIKKKIKNKNGKYEKYSISDIEYDTLDNGKLLYKNLPGNYKKEIYENLANFRDGDIKILNNKLDKGNSTKNMYNSPNRKFIVDSHGRIKLQKDKNKRTTDISDETRVVKGGSWKDPIYWMDPGQRRYLHQADSKNWIGFRVAQEYNGDYQSKRR